MNNPMTAMKRTEPLPTNPVAPKVAKGRFSGEAVKLGLVSVSGTIRARRAMPMTQCVAAQQYS